MARRDDQAVDQRRPEVGEDRPARGGEDLRVAAEGEVAGDPAQGDLEQVGLRGQAGDDQPRERGQDDQRHHDRGDVDEDPVAEESRISHRHPVVLGAQQPDVDDRQHHDEDDDQVGQRRAVAEELVREGPLVGVVGDALRAVGGPAPGHHVDDVEHLEGLDRAQDEHHHDHRSQQRQRDVHEAAPPAVAVDAGRLVEVAGDGGQPGEQEEGHQRRVLPHVGPHHDVERGERRAQERVVGGGDAQLGQRRVDHPVLGVEEVAPHGAVDDRRQRPRQHHDRPEQPAPAQRRVEQQRDPHPEHQLEAGGDEREVRGALDRRPEIRLLQRELVVVEPDPREVPGERRVDREQRRVQRPQDRIDDDPEDDDDARRQQRQRETALAASGRASSCRPYAGRGGLAGLRAGALGRHQRLPGPPAGAATPAARSS